MTDCFPPLRILERGRSIGILYKSPIDCMWQTAKAEGVIRGLYKGTTAHLLRIAPHTVLTLVMNEAYLVSFRQISFPAARS